jgi:lantibiotic modifying enzyme
MHQLSETSEYGDEEEGGLACGENALLLTAMEYFSYVADRAIVSHIHERLALAARARTPAAAESGLVGLIGDGLVYLRAATLTDDVELGRHGSDLIFYGGTRLLRTRNHDFLTGMAGALCASQYAAKVLDRDKFDRLSTALALRLLALKVDFGPVDGWLSRLATRSDHVALLGFGHGAAGVVFALRSFALARGADTVVEAIDQLAVRFETYIRDLSTERIRSGSSSAIAPIIELNTRHIGSWFDGLVGIASACGKPLESFATIPIDCDLQATTSRIGYLHGASGVLVAIASIPDATAPSVSLARRLFDVLRACPTARLNSRPKNLFRGGLGVIHAVLVAQAGIPCPLFGMLS